MRVTRLILGPLETNCWILGDDAGGPCIVIDPADDAPRILRELGDSTVQLVVLTHAHFDHIGAVAELLAETGAPLAAHADDAEYLATAEGTGGAAFGFDNTAPTPDRLLADGDVIQAGALTVTVLHTPGHTPGGICLLATDGQGAEHLFSGDTLFSGSVGRTDFPRGDGRALARSIAQKLSPLDSTTQVHPGHGPDTTIAREARLNPFWPRA
jgi:hydroxyacylglutathione hydrolase